MIKLRSSEKDIVQPVERLLKISDLMDKHKKRQQKTNKQKGDFPKI